MTEKVYYINQLEKGQVLDGELFGLTQIKRANDRNNKPYLDLEMVDKTGSIKAKVWSDSLDRIENSALEEGQVISVNGIVSEFNGTAQLTVQSIASVKNYDIGNFVMSSSKDIDELWNDLSTRVKKIKSTELKTILEKLLSTYKDEIKKSPAARGMHHHFIGGLLEHVIEMLKIADSVTELYPEADPDMVTAGIIFHDIGKIKEYAVDGFQIVHTKEGKLIGHIVIGIQMLNNLNTDILSEETRLRLSHIILSHHTIKEFGSPVTPVTIEAMIVAKIDDLSAKVRLVQKVLENNKDSNSVFAKREFGIEGEIYLGE